MAIQQFEDVGPRFHHPDGGIKWNSDAISFLGNEDQNAVRIQSILLDPILTTSIFTKLANIVIEDNKDEALLKLVISTFGEVDWPTSEMCPFFIYVFLYLGSPLVHSMRCAADVSFALAA
jgi:hypothetical protein